MRTPAGAKFPLPLLYDVASQYYGENATQDEIAARMKVSRPSVSRLLAEARRVGIVEITVHPPESGTDRVLSGRVAAALGLREVYVVRAGSGPDRGRWLAAGLSLALTDAALTLGDVLLVSSGMTLYQCAQQDLPQIAGVVVIPTVGGQEEPEPWYQTNVLASMFAERMDGRPTYLYAPALPTATLHRSLLREPSFIRMQELWESAKVAVVGVGAPVGARAAVPNFVRHEGARANNRSQLRRRPPSALASSHPKQIGPVRGEPLPQTPRIAPSTTSCTTATAGSTQQQRPLFTSWRSSRKNSHRQVRWAATLAAALILQPRPLPHLNSADGLAPA